METERLILYTDGDGSLKGLPKFPPHKQVEISFRVTEQAFRNLRRTPNPDIAGKVRINGDILSTVLEEDWNLPR